MPTPETSAIDDEGILAPLAEQVLIGVCRKIRSQGGDWMDPIREAQKEASRQMEATHKSGQALLSCMNYCKAVEKLIRVIFQLALDDTPDARGKIALVAMGGFGRGELSPGSDVDFRFFVHPSVPLAAKELASTVVQTLWSVPFYLGQGFDTVRGTLKQITGGQFNIFTSSLESRFIVGEPKIYEEFNGKLQKIIKKRKSRFVDAIVENRNNRLERYGTTPQLKEPDVKEAAGGLRDYHNARWLLCLIRGIPVASRLEIHELLTKDDAESLKTGIHFLTKVRNEIHFQTHSSRNHLTLDLQKSLAVAFGYEDDGISLGVEKFMQDYYRQAKSLHRVSEMLIEQCLYGGAPRRGPRSLVLGRRHPGYVEKFGRLFLYTKSIRDMQESPSNVMDFFSAVAERNLPASEQARKELRELAKSWDSASAQNAEVSESFRFIAGLKSGFSRALSEMHSTGFLSKILPEFEGLDCFSQFDPYHHYTADEHTFRVIRNLEKLGQDQKEENADYSEVLKGVELRRALNLGLLFHDMAKWKKGNHSLVGAEMAWTALTRLGLPEDEIRVVAWLVKNHLVMANIFQRRDLTDSRVIYRLAAMVGDQEVLALLTLLTYADIKAVGPGVWNSTMANLLIDLYRRTAVALESRVRFAEVYMGGSEKLKQKVLDIHKDKNLDQQIGQQFDKMPDRYFATNGPEQIAEHVTLLADIGDEKFKMSWLMESQSVRLTLATLDGPRLLSQMAGCLAAHAIKVVHAELFVRSDGVVINTFRLDSAGMAADSVERAMEGFKRDISKVLVEQVDVAQILGNRESSHLPSLKKKLRIETQIRFDNESSEQFTVIDLQAQDFVGLLYMVSSTLSDLSLDIAFARITTQADRAVDAFYVMEQSGGKLSPERQESVNDALVSGIEERQIAMETV